MNIKILDLPQFVGKKLEDVDKYLKEQNLTPAGTKELEYVMEHLDEFPELKDESLWFYFFGAKYLRDADGRWGIPYVDWHGSTLNRDAGWLSSGWDANERVLLVSTGSDSSCPAPGGNSPLIAAVAIKKGAEVEVRGGKVYPIKKCHECGQKIV